MKQRAVTAVFFATAMLLGIYGGRLPFFILFGLVAAGSLWELSGLLFSREEPHFPLRRLVALVLGIFPYLWMGKAILFHWVCGDHTPDEVQRTQYLISLYSSKYVLVGIASGVFLVLFLELFFAASKPFTNFGHFLAGIFYVTVPLIFLMLMAYDGREYHPHRVFGMLWLVWTNDTLAYLVGSRIGKRKLFERISPNKTWEGTLGGVAGALLMAWGLARLIPDFTTAQWLALSAVAGVFGTAGDLVESMLKRSVGVKDSGAFFPGHGGFLDRFDAFLFMLPFAWLAVWALGG